MKLDQLRRLIELRRIRLGAAEQQVAGKRRAREDAQAALQASQQRQHQCRQLIDVRCAMLERQREQSEDVVATLMRVEDYIKGLRMSLAREQVVGGRAESIVARCQSELEQAALELWRCRHRMSHCEALLKRALLRRQRRTELALEGTSMARPLSMASMIKPAR